MLPQEDDTSAKDFDLFGPGPEPSMPPASAGIVQGMGAQSGSMEDRMKQLTTVVQELTTGVAAPSAQPLGGAAQGAPAASSSDVLDPYKPKGPQIPMLKLRASTATHAESGPPPDSPSSGSSSSEDEDRPACRMCGSTKHLP